MNLKAGAYCESAGFSLCAFSLQVLLLCVVQLFHGAFAAGVYIDVLHLDFILGFTLYRLRAV
jgi:hypothetical protein